MLKGIGASEGYGIGKIMIVEEKSLEYTPHAVNDIDAEIKRYSDAVEAFIEETKQQAEALRVSAGAKEAEIMEGHIGIINDPGLKMSIEGLITGGTCVEAATEQTLDMFIGIFAATDDEMTQQRAADLKDIKHALLSILLGVNEVKISEAPAGTVLVAKEVTPSMTAGINKDNIVGIITETGSQTSHSAILARAMEIPAVLSVPNALSQLSSGEQVIVDGTNGEVITAPGEAEITDYTARRDAFLREKRELEMFRGRRTLSASGEEYELCCNIGSPKDAGKAMQADGEGVGLFRTEFLFMDRTALPTEDEQFEVYKAAAVILKGKPLIIRTLDIGGDKQVAYMNMPQESNPFLGYRAIRLCLDRREVFRVQLRAILRASAYGKVAIMFPMIATVEELRSAKAVLQEARDELDQEGVSYDRDIRVGIMIETPAAVQISDHLAREADFFSIGTNDLIQYTMATDRMNDRVQYLYHTCNPAVLRSVRMICKNAAEAGIPVNMCGEAASDPLVIPLWVAMGLKELSVVPAQVAQTKYVIDHLPAETLRGRLDELLRLPTVEEFQTTLRDIQKEFGLILIDI